MPLPTASALGLSAIVVGLLRVAGEAEEDLLERRRLQRQLVQRGAGREGDVAHLVGGSSLHVERVAVDADLGSVACQRRGEVGGARRAHADAFACQETGDRSALDQATAMDDDHVVDGLLDLGEHVAGDEHRAALRGSAAQDVAQPANALRVQAVRGLVEDEHLGIAQERGGEAQALAHPGGVAARAPIRGNAHLDEIEHLVHARRRQSGEGGEGAQMVAPRASRMHSADLEVRSDRARRIRKLDERLPEDRRAPRGGPSQAEHHAQRRRLARAVGTEEAGDRARTDLEGEFVHRGDRAVALGQAVGDDGWSVIVLVRHGVTVARRRPRARVPPWRDPRSQGCPTLL
jgi:hypothetical protein